MRKVRFMWLITVMLIGWITAQLAAKAAVTKPLPEKTVSAFRLTETIRVDGVLSEVAWQKEGISDFTQSNPTDGAAPTEKTIVWVAFDDKALYVAARLLDSQPDKIISRLVRRDDSFESDWFLFAVDPYFDRRSGFQFMINPAGSIYDSTLYNDQWEDGTWDGVWEGVAKIDQQGWTAEIRIPFDQLRFKKSDRYLWGVNFQRMVKRKNEQVGLIWVPKEENAYVSRFARLEGIENIKPGRHIEVLPYAVGRETLSPAEPGNPFQTGQRFFANGGLDLKVGLKSNLTLDATVNPDFGQVEVDPAVINLSAFETRYTEKRPFFIEGVGIFNFGQGGSTSYWGFDWGNPSFFYSRRIGRSPQGGVDTDGYVDYPESTTILAAAKITGKIGNDWNIGFLNALTSPEYAAIDLDGSRSRQAVEPLADYGVLRVQKEFNEGRQGLGFMATSVVRDLDEDGLSDVLNKNAFSLAMDGWTFLNKNKSWVFSGWMGGTLVQGSAEAISRLQRSPLHYFQRPDANHITLDDTRKSLSGLAGRFTLNKQKGNWLFNAALGFVTPGFDSTDLGFQYRGDLINAHLAGGYQVLQPGKLFRYWMLIGAAQRSSNFGGDNIGTGYYLIGEGQFLNYWVASVTLGYYPDCYNDVDTRGGPQMLQPRFGFVNFYSYSDNRKKIGFELNGGMDTSPSGWHDYTVNPIVSWKPRSNIKLSIGPSYTYSHYLAQWVTWQEDALMTATYGSRYVLAGLDQQRLSAEIRLNWIFTPRLSLQLYLQPFIAVGDYFDFKELARPRTFDFNVYGQGLSSIAFQDGAYTVDPDGSGLAAPFSFGDPDFNFKSLRGTAVLRWEFRPGSVLYLVWTQNRSDFENTGVFDFSRNFRDMWRAQGDNIFLLKFSYRFKI